MAPHKKVLAEGKLNLTIMISGGGEEGETKIALTGVAKEVAYEIARLAMANVLDKDDDDDDEIEPPKLTSTTTRGPGGRG